MCEQVSRMREPVEPAYYIAKEYGKQNIPYWNSSRIWKEAYETLIEYMRKSQIETLSKDDPCWEGYEMVGFKDKDGKKVPNCVPIEASADGEYDLETFADYPDAVKNNAKRGIELNEKNGNKCATQTGKVRAQQLAKGEGVSIETIKRMHSYLSRAEEYYDPSDTSACGTISYLLWGGKSAKSWAQKKLREKDMLNKLEELVKNGQSNKLYKRWIYSIRSRRFSRNTTFLWTWSYKKRSSACEMRRLTSMMRPDMWTMQ